MSNPIYNRKILYSKDAREKIIAGVNGLADAVGSTMGPGGKNVAIKLGLQDVRFTKDGVSVAREVFFPDPFMNLGAESVSHVALRTNEQCGDGTTSATVLARSMIVENADLCDLEKVCENLKAMAVPVKNVRDVALVSANNDAEIAAAVAGAYEDVGVDGQVRIELSPEPGIRRETVMGMSFARGYSSPYFVTNPQKMICELENVRLVFSPDPLTSMDQVMPTMQECQKDGKSLLFVAPEIGGEALSVMVTNKVKRNFPCAAIKSGGLQEGFLEDVRLSVGAHENKVGHAKKVVLYHDRTIIMEGDGDKELIEKRCEYLRQEKMQDRLARLASGVCVLWVGGSTQSEAEERRDRVEDAVGAVRSAFDGGIVPGGGVALFRATRGTWLDKVGEAPLRQIMKNAGVDADNVVAGLDHYPGFDARKLIYCDLMDAGIVDPVKVVIHALRDAASVATLIGSTECAIIEEAK